MVRRVNRDSVVWAGEGDLDGILRFKLQGDGEVSFGVDLDTDIRKLKSGMWRLVVLDGLAAAEERNISAEDICCTYAQHLIETLEILVQVFSMLQV